MELLVVTLAYTTPERDTDGLSDIRLVLDTVRMAPGLVTLRSYQGRGDDAGYLILSTWQDEEAWQKARERYNPRQLLLSTASDLLVTAPKQWLMQYLWGYSRPAAQPIIAAAHVASVRPEQGEYARRGWMECLRRQVVQPAMALSSAFLARGIDEDTLLARADPLAEETAYLNGPVFLNMLNWPDEANREEYYADPDYQAINRFLSGVGVIQMISLEPF